MDLMLTFAPAAPAQLINYKQPLVFMGSCFADNIAELAQQHGLPTLAQPFGVVFNPISIAQQLQRIITGTLYTESDLHLHQELWHTWEHHTQFSNTSKEEFLQHINQQVTHAHQFIHQPNVVVGLTLGSAHVYALAHQPQTIVANCHKYPQQHFTKSMLAVEQVVQALQQVMQQLPHAKFILTVSPVRHIKDGVVENNLSKAILLQAVHQLNQTEQVYYFPAYELVIDQLRDYRFYDTDMVHPNVQAIQFVWQSFIKTCFDSQAQAYVNDMHQLYAMQNHRVMHTGTQAHQKFVQALAQKQADITAKYF